jgi:hypothetical protein
MARPPVNVFASQSPPRARNGASNEQSKNSTMRRTAGAGGFMDFEPPPMYNDPDPDAILYPYL